MRVLRRKVGRTIRSVVMWPGLLDIVPLTNTYPRQRGLILFSRWVVLYVQKATCWELVFTRVKPKER